MFATSLNAEQEAVATFEGGPLRVLAGAGTGKTTALTARVAGLVERGTRPERIMLLTFTRRAAREMVTRAEARLERSGPGSRGKVVGGTFHSVAHRTLRRHASKLGLPDAFTVLDPADAADLLDLVRDELGAARERQRRFPRKATLLDLYSRAVDTQQPLAQAVEHVAPWCADLVEPIGEICREYVTRKRRLGLLDFDDLLLWWRAALHDERLGASLGAAVDHVLVDEYQDVNRLQVDVLQALRRGDDRITVVGDDSQAIYGFRAASPRHLLDFADAFPGAATIVLQRNYRSSQPICDVANAIGADAPEGFTARLVAHEPPGTRPELVRCADEDAQVHAVCDRVLEHRECGVRLRDQAVLVRAAHHGALLELELSARRVPYVKYGGLRFLEAAHVKDLICLFRLTDNPDDELAWFRALQLLDGVGPATARRVIDALQLGEPGVLARWPGVHEIVPVASRERADALVDALGRVDGERAGAHAARLRDALRPLVADHYDDAAARLADLDTLVEAARDAVRLSEVATELSLEPPHSTGDLAGPPLIDEDWLVISTVHSAKGLEWSVVHVLNATDGNFPSDMALTSDDGLEEERRLFYVATTRPRRALHVYTPLRFHHRPRGRDDAHSYGQPSRFLSPGVRACFDTTGHEHVERELAVTPVAPVTEIDLALDALFS
jgi:DNA helicase-2/ATP-dependent DNA helicase PcrA